MMKCLLGGLKGPLLLAMGLLNQSNVIDPTNDYKLNIFVGLHFIVFNSVVEDIYYLNTQSQ